MKSEKTAESTCFRLFFYKNLHGRQKFKNLQSSTFQMLVFILEYVQYVIVREDDFRWNLFISACC